MPEPSAAVCLPAGILSIAAKHTELFLFTIHSDLRSGDVAAEEL